MVINNHIIIYFVRHAESVGIVTRRVLDNVDNVLTEHGKLQARLLGEYLQLEHFSAVYVSSASCAIETANLVLSESKVCPTIPIVQDVRLREKSLGVHKGKSATDVLKHFLIAGQEYCDWVVEDGESKADVEKRIADFLQSLFRKCDDATEPQRILIVSHSGICLHLIKYMTAKRDYKFTLKRWKPEYYKMLPTCGYFKVSVTRKSSVTNANEKRDIEILTAHGKEHLHSLAFEDILHKMTFEDNNLQHFPDCVQQ